MLVDKASHARSSIASNVLPHGWLPTLLRRSSCTVALLSRFSWYRERLHPVRLEEEPEVELVGRQRPAASSGPSLACRSWTAAIKIAGAV
jgi:hypothetical protein